MCFPGAPPNRDSPRCQKLHHEFYININGLTGGARGSRTPDLLNAIQSIAPGISGALGFGEKLENPKSK
jgi:hypothetical protein